MDTAKIEAPTTGATPCPAPAAAAIASAEPPPACPLPEGDKAIRFPRGLPGFPGARRFGLEPVPGTRERFLLLRSLEDAELRFVVMPYAVGIHPLAAADLGEACASLGVASDDAVALLVVTTQRTGAGLQLYVNLRAPIILDARQGMAAQYVLPHGAYPVRHPLPRA